jgi:hypothetical protein
MRIDAPLGWELVEAAIEIGHAGRRVVCTAATDADAEPPGRLLMSGWWGARDSNPEPKD